MAATVREQLRQRVKEMEEQQNPCRRLQLVDDARDLHGTNCNQVTCPDCGPLKTKRLWEGVASTFGAQAHLAMVTNEEEYQKLRNNLRQRRHRAGGGYEYVSWHIGGDRRMILISDPIDGITSNTMVASIKASLLDCYRKGLASLRKSWSVAIVTLSRVSLTESVTGRLRFWKRPNRQEEILDKAVEDQRQRLLNAGLDPDEWDVWDENGTLKSTINAGQIPDA